jgi:hypothetical protein
VLNSYSYLDLPFIFVFDTNLQHLFSYSLSHIFSFVDLNEYVSLVLSVVLSLMEIRGASVLGHFMCMVPLCVRDQVRVSFVGSMLCLCRFICICLVNVLCFINRLLTVGLPCEDTLHSIFLWQNICLL